MCSTRGIQAIDVTNSNNPAFMGVIQQSDASNPWSTTLSVSGTPVHFKIDTGAIVPMIPNSIHQNIQHSTLQPPAK